ncbi:hypothetical protein PC116_g28551 [Phytophthora cactorum]|uniref:Uncharacterized protein n=1 Tax=Phytophthora cactorum TaxID=29920 RepID=A0A8T1EYM1_9STRA|nr:hypothetical protein PC118_g24025 [Phytophthora cactorum]KAG4222976.1 hypothetical protein PC116_g28551 [Phytophthora cactorum]
MRLLLWVLLLTLTIFLSGTNGASSKLAKWDPTERYKLKSVVQPLPARILSADYKINAKRSLRGSSEKGATNDNDLVKIHTNNDEERGIINSRIVEMVSGNIAKIKAGLGLRLSKLRMKIIDMMYWKLYKMGAIPRKGASEKFKDPRAYHFSYERWYRMNTPPGNVKRREWWN